MPILVAGFGTLKFEFPSCGGRLTAAAYSGRALAGGGHFSSNRRQIRAGCSHLFYGLLELQHGTACVCSWSSQQFCCNTTANAGWFFTCRWRIIGWNCKGRVPVRLPSIIDLRTHLIQRASQDWNPATIRAAVTYFQIFILFFAFHIILADDCTLTRQHDCRSPIWIACMDLSIWQRLQRSFKVWDLQ